ncbi:sodium/calcium exchanger NCL-like [Neltuma alba]|uniref:sodium/calcium exchanger NCL n=1 Tax=Neltuma alba TaxID=207710 RepID=UPI0010A4A13D|nr:sodium/calcium exchanger NCL-like [Prosopis alba]XP_028792961.1 sodium/calcium exchanger NCL-like [Prosopis alba]
MRNVSKPACFIFILLLSVVLEVEGRYLQHSASSALFTSDGVDEDGVQPQKNSHLFLRGNTGKTEPFEEQCEQMYGFLPCSTSMLGHLFLILVYEFLLFHGESYLASGGEQIFKILGPGLFGASAFDLLGALPESLILLVTGLSRETKESAQEYASTGVGMLAGSSILLLTIVWGTCVITGRQNLKTDSRNRSSHYSNSSRATPKELLAGFGITIDKETKEMARIMILSVIPFIIMQIPSVFRFSAVLRSVTLMGALTVTVIFVLLYFIYQIFKPHIEKTRLEYIKHHDLILRIFEHVEKQTLQKILTEDGSPNVAAINGLYNEISQHGGERDLLASEVKELLLKNKLTGTDISEGQVEDMLRVFDRNGDQIITKEEFVTGLTQWIEQTKHALDKQYMPRKSLQNIYQGFLKPWMEHMRKEREIKGHLVSEILRHAQSDMVVQLLNDDGTADESAIRRLFEEVDSNRDNSVSQSEIRKLVTNLHFGKAVDEEEAVKKIIQDFDINSDNVITEEEFVDGFTKWVLSSSKQAPHSKPQPHQEETHQTWEYVEKVVEEKHQHKGIYGWIMAIINVVVGITILSILAEPLIASVQKFSAAAGIPSFFASFILVPLATNFREATSAIKEASHKKRSNTSQTMYEIYGAVFMNNILGFSAIATLIYVREITWEFSAEVLVVAIVCSVMGLSASFRPNFPLWTSFGAYLLYWLSLVLVYVLNDVLHYE